jgi:hypothetical protein
MKIALCLGDDLERAGRRVSTMLDAQRHEPGCADRRLPFARGCLGLLGRPDEPTSEWPLWESADGSFLVFAGLPLTDARAKMPGPARLDDLLARGALSASDPTVALERLGGLDGAFVAVWWNVGRGELTLVTDFLGMQPLYRAQHGTTTLFASEAKAFVRGGGMDVEADAGAWGAMLYFGHQIGPRSLLAGVTRVPAASTTTFTASGDERAIGTWRWPESVGAGDTPSLRDEVGEALRIDVAAYAASHPHASLLLSGGFDSRLILCLCRDIGLRPDLLVQSHADENADADARFAHAFARLVGLRPRHFASRSRFFSTDEYLRFLNRNEIATPSLYLFIAHVASVLAAERRGVWEGLLLDPALKFDYGAGGFGPYLQAREGARRVYRDAARLVFAPDFRTRIDDEYATLLAAERARHTEDAEGVWRFSVLNRSRFRTGVNPYQVYDTITPPLTPGMSKRFWEVVAQADPSARFGKRLYRSVFQHLAPDGLRVPVATGARLLPGREGALLYHAQRARAALQRTARRPRAHRLLRAVGLPTAFAWESSRFLDTAVREADLDDPRLNADWLRRRRAGGSMHPVDCAASEVLMYWQAWHNVMRGSLLAAWGEGAD